MELYKYFKYPNIMIKLLILIISLLLLSINIAFSNNLEDESSEYYITNARLSNNLQEKSKYLRIACEIDKKNFTAFFELGKVLLDLKNKEGLKFLYLAQQSTSKRLQKNIYNTLFNYYYYDLPNRDLINSNILLKKILKFDDNYKNNFILAELNSIKGLKDYSNSIYFFLKALDKTKEKNIIYYYLAENYYYLKDFSNTIEWLKNILIQLIIKKLFGCLLIQIINFGS